MIRSIAIAVICIATTSVHASDYVKVDRYLELSTAPTAGQKDVLSLPVTKTIPSNIKQTDKAISYLLKPVAWQLVPVKNRAKDIAILMPYQLADHHRDLIGQSLETALLTLAGPAYQLVVDPVHRMVTFKLREEYRI